MYKNLLLLFPLFFTFINSYSQNSYRVYLNDKGNQEFNPYTFFDHKAIERRLREEIPVYDYSDKPVYQAYIDELQTIADSTGFCSRWFNFIKVYVSNEYQIIQIKALPYVSHIEQSKPVLNEYCSIYATETSDDKLLVNQTKRMGAEYFEKNNIDGSGIRIAVFDGGFPEVNTHPAFEHIRNSGRLIKTFDFTKKKENVYYGSSHGRQTFACVGGIYNDTKIGLATGAEYLLAKTEVEAEPYKEEEWWLAAAEWADQNGADIINSSLGYGHQRYFTSDMDGKTSLVVKAAEMAVRKGILVVNSAGNEANDKWKGIITPADGDSVLAIGGIDPATDYHIDFSSYGPTADKRLKPNVSAYGSVTTASAKGLGNAQGTSFSSPLVAGFAACAWQTKPEMKVMELFHEIEKSGHLFPYYDYAHGYGVPQAAYFTGNIGDIIETFEIIDSANMYYVKIKPARFNNTDWMQDMNLLYYHQSDEDGYISFSEVVQVQELIPYSFPVYIKGTVVRIHFRGYTKTIKF